MLTQNCLLHPTLQQLATSALTRDGSVCCLLCADENMFFKSYSTAGSNFTALTRAGSLSCCVLTIKNFFTSHTTAVSTSALTRDYSLNCCMLTRKFFFLNPTLQQVSNFGAYQGWVSELLCVDIKKKIYFHTTAVSNFSPKALTRACCMLTQKKKKKKNLTLQQLATHGNFSTYQGWIFELLRVDKPLLAGPDNDGFLCAPVVRVAVDVLLLPQHSVSQQLNHCATGQHSRG